MHQLPSQLGSDAIMPAIQQLLISVLCYAMLYICTVGTTYSSRLLHCLNSSCTEVTTHSANIHAPCLCPLAQPRLACSAANSNPRQTCHCAAASQCSVHIPTQLPPVKPFLLFRSLRPTLPPWASRVPRSLRSGRQLACTRTCRDAVSAMSVAAGTVMQVLRAVLTHLLANA
jgi:hypothetical protein